MGTRSNYQSLTGVVQAFASQNTWRQSELAQQVGVQPRALRNLLAELQAAGMPLVRDEEHPHVYWSVPSGWFPGGVIQTARLHVTIGSGRIHTPDAQALIVELTVRGLGSDSTAWFDTAHTWIVKGFTDLSSDKSHEQWSPIQ